MGAYSYNKMAGCLVGLSTDTKPTSAEKGDICLEIDTGVVYQYTGTAWIVMP